ncbi:SUMF1/EgtB/PvdO family nonheme iron enzyme, partial [candidate division KSB1 bacterium]|nr:SUMF1/EgtB/PvdO family nonheme iron enzyme [candidate division KSB1 bacterium]
PRGVEAEIQTSINAPQGGRATAPAFPGRTALKGLRPFDKEDAELFQSLQRERELHDCLSAITDREFRLGILFGESGCGKTSFVQAGLWAMLPQFSPTHFPIYVKFSELDPLVSVRHALREQLPQSTFEKFVHSTIPPLRGARGVSRAHAEQQQHPPTPPQGGNFLAPASDIVSLLAHAAQTLGKTLVLFFDQFEQFFLHYPKAEQRTAFIAALKEWYDHAPALPVKILLSLRQDYYGHHYELQQTLRYSLGPQDSIPLRKFSPKQAVEIFHVLAETARLAFDRDFVEEMTSRDLAAKEDGLISPVDIQILTWMASAQEHAGLNRAAFQKMGGVEGLLENYVKRSLDALATKAEQQTALKVLLSLIDLEHNLRAGALTSARIKEKLSADASLHAEAIDRAINWLASNKVRLITPVSRDETLGYELAHERLIQPLRRLTNKELSEVDQANLLLERRANEWLGNNRDARYLLNWRELRRVQKQRAYLTWGQRAEVKQELLQHSRGRLKRNLLLAFSPLVLFMVCWFGVRLYEHYQFAQRRAQIAKLGLEFADIPGGTFRMGDLFGDGYDDERPVHQVTLSAFKLSKHEITNEQYCAFLNDDPERNLQGLFEADGSRIVEQDGRYVPEGGFEKHPVANVTWYGANAFCEWLGGRLPTEAQWEYAARAAGDSIRYPWGNEEPDTTKANFDPSGNYTGATKRVGTYLANELGLYDMAGNVWEWCNDWYGDYPVESQTDPNGPADGFSRVVRGGAFHYLAGIVRCSFRDGLDPDLRLDYVGFRIALSP